MELHLSCINQSKISMAHGRKKQTKISQPASSQTELIQLPAILHLSSAWLLNRTTRTLPYMLHLHWLNLREKWCFGWWDEPTISIRKRSLKITHTATHPRGQWVNCLSYPKQKDISVTVLLLTIITKNTSVLKTEYELRWFFLHELQLLWCWIYFRKHKDWCACLIISQHRNGAGS